MNAGNYELEKQSLLNRLLDATKECQVRFGGKNELATEVDSRVSCLCSTWEAVLQHGMKHSNRALSTLKQVTEKTGLTKMKGISILQDISNMETEPVFWHYVREHLNKQELQRYHLLNNINTDAGRGRAWLRSTFNEHSLERYLHMLLEDPNIMRQYYEDWAFILDQEKSSMMPIMAAGLNSILFAISIDQVDLNTIRNAKGLESLFNSSPPKQLVFTRVEEEPRPVIAGDSSPQADRKRLKKKKKKPAHLVSFDEDDVVSSYSASPASSVTSPIATEGFGQIPSVADVQASFVSQQPVDLSPSLTFSTHTGPAKSYSEQYPVALVPDKYIFNDDYIAKTGPGSGMQASQTNSFKPDITSPTINHLADLQSLIDSTQSTMAKCKELQLDTNSDSCSGFSEPYTQTGVSSSEQMQILDRHAGWRGADKATITPGGSTTSLDKEESSSSSQTDSLVKGHKRSVSESYAQWLASCDTANSSKSVINSITERDRSSSLEHNLGDKRESPEHTWKGRVTGRLDKTPSPSHPIMHRWDSFTSNDSTDVRSIASASSYEDKCSHSRNSSQDFGRAENLPMFMTPLSPDGNPVDDHMLSTEDARSTTSSDALSYLEDASHATLALSLAESSSKYSSELFRTQGDGSTAPEPAPFSQDSLSTAELKQAVIDMMMRKDECEEFSRILKVEVEAEKERCLALQLELDEYRRSAQQTHDRDATRIKALVKENELLKHQLKKYVNAVQMLRTQNATSTDVGRKFDVEIIPPQKTTIDYSHEASEYERKLIQVAEMHGELMEFNEVLHRQLNQKEAQLHRLRQELTNLRGPLPEDLQGSDDSGSSHSENDIRARPLVNIWVPSVFLRGSPAEAHHVYQVFIRIKDEEWTVYKRYSEFYELHVKLKKKAPIVNTYGFPPKKALGNKDPKFVEDRRKKLQQYLRQVVQLQIQLHPELSTGVSKAKLIHALSFLSDLPLVERHKGKGRVKTKSRSSANRTDPPQVPPNTYMGL